MRTFPFALFFCQCGLVKLFGGAGLVCAWLCSIPQLTRSEPEPSVRVGLCLYSDWRAPQRLEQALLEFQVRTRWGDWRKRPWGSFCVLRTGVLLAIARSWWLVAHDCGKEELLEALGLGLLSLAACPAVAGTTY